MTLELSYADGQLAALARYKLGFPAPTNPHVATITKPTSPTLSQTATQNLAAPTDPQQVAQIFSSHEQGQSRSEPIRKLSAENLCTTCRKSKHYGSCNQPRPIPTKAADFNTGMLGTDPSQQNNPSTSPHYHSATSADSALARSRDGRPSDEQAATGFADLFRAHGGGINGMADEPGRMTGGLHKVARVRKLADFMLPGSEGHSMHEQRGPSVNPYEERKTRLSPPVGWGDEGDQRIDRMFRQFDNPVDTTNVGGGFGDPQPGPAALG